MKTDLTSKECFEKIKEHIFLPQEYNKDWLEMKLAAPLELRMLHMELKKKEQKDFDKLVKKYLEN